VNVLKAAEKTMQLEIDALKEAAPQRAAVGARGLTRRYRSAARLARRAGPVARRSPSPAETAEGTSHAVHRNRGPHRLQVLVRSAQLLVGASARQPGGFTGVRSAELPDAPI
jgi:hypothetical protein